MMTSSSLHGTTNSNHHNNNVNRNDEDAPSRNLLVPPFDAPSRQSNTAVAVFNLIATIVGGGVLSLPLAFAKLGIGLATCLMVVAAVVTDQSLYLLCLSARLTGATSYGEVGRVALGPAMETIMAVLLFVFLLFVITAYQVLLRDIWTPLLLVLWWRVTGSSRHDDDQDHKQPEQEYGNTVLLGMVILLIPFVVQHSLHALRYNCFVGFGSVSLLCAALCHHAFWGTQPTQYSNSNDDNEDNSMLYMTDQVSNVLFAFPIIMLSYLSHFNILPIQSALQQPSRARTRTVVHGAVGGSGWLMYTFGLAGYIYAGAATEGNILLNLVSSSRPHEEEDVMFVVGRWGVGITSTFFVLVFCARVRLCANGFYCPLFYRHCLVF